MFQLFAIPDLQRFGCPLVLASASPRRRELLSAYGLQFKFFAPDVLEKHEPGESPSDYVQRNALLKAKDVARRHESTTSSALILAGDTIVVSSDGRILEKPQDASSASATLASLSGQKHKVVSSIVICYGSKGDLLVSKVIETIVEFSEIPSEWIASYVATNDPLDKAGSYGIQGIAGAFVRRIEGSYTNVVGLPLNECLHLLQDLLLVRAFYLSVAHASETDTSVDQKKTWLLQKNKDSIVAISKKQEAHNIRFAYHLGQRHFGENYVQELKSKATALSDLKEIVWHFTGTIQSNKIKEIAKNAHVVHSLESLSKAEQLNTCCAELNRKMAVFIKVATTAQTQATSGCSWPEAQTIAAYLSVASNLEFLGFMAMGPADANKADLFELYLTVMRQGVKIWNEAGMKPAPVKFSLGMSGDFEIACVAAEQLGINPPLLRLGTAIFGKR